MNNALIYSLLIPFLGTTLGSASVFFTNKEMKISTKKALSGFAPGVMVAAAFFSLIIPAINMSENLGKLQFLPVFVGFWIGFIFLLALDELIPHIHQSGDEEGLKGSHLKRSIKMMLAIALHNLPEGMTVGILYAGYKSGAASISLTSTIVLALGIAIQNFPEGMIVSIPFRADGASKKKSFIYGTLSGAVEPLGALLAIALSSLLTPIIPYTLSFAAGAMLYVVIEELIPEMSEGEHSNIGIMMFGCGFTLMLLMEMVLS